MTEPVKESGPHGPTHARENTRKEQIKAEEEEAKIRTHKDTYIYSFILRFTLLLLFGHLTNHPSLIINTHTNIT